MYASCLHNDGQYYRERFYSINDFDYTLLKAHKSKKRIKKYIRIPATFDIESTTINTPDGYKSYMYIWQMCIEGYVVMGRKWDEWLQLLDKLKEIYELNSEQKLVIYVHNLSFEFVFIHDFINFTSIFATDPHKVLKCSNDFFEFRCSYRLSNMSLAKFIENTPNAVHSKAVDDLDYRVVRTADTELSELEYGYCFNDVMGLYEAVCHLLEEDNIKKIPMTSTGYVRRDCRRAMQANRKNKDLFRNTSLSPLLFTMMEEARRGGNTASSRYLANTILEHVGSYDISSSYPFSMLLPMYPVGKFMKYTVDTLEELYKLNKKYCTIARYCFTNLRLKTGVSVPYISKSKCSQLIADYTYNGRVINCNLAVITLTEIDFNIIESQYEYDDLSAKDFYISRRGLLPEELREQILHYFYLKSTLKGDKEHYYEYMKSKNKLNSIFGMMLTSPVHPEITFTDGQWIQTPVDLEEGLKKFYANKKSFLPYQWGVWVTAISRMRLQKGLDKVGLDVVYCDTDSVKYIDDHTDIFEQMNKDTLEYCKQNSIQHTVEYNNKTYYLGLWDSENDSGSYAYRRFKTLGAKKYAYEFDNGKIGVTVAGLSKSKGAAELQKVGLEGFVNGKVFTDSGRTVAYFNEEAKHIITVNGCKMVTASNIAIVDTTYTLGITDTMLNIIELSKLEEEKDGRFTYFDSY